MIDLDEIEILIQAVSGDLASDATAVLDRETGQTWLLSDYADEDGEPPEGWDTDDRYLTLPTQRELDLGSHTARRFVDAHLPEHHDTFREIFSRKGAFGRWKHWLERNGHLDAWYAFETEAERAAIRAWLVERGLDLT